MTGLLVLGLLCLAGFVQSLHYENEQEGHCLNVPSADNVNLTWVASTEFPYVSGGSKYHLYRLISTSPRFSKLREFEFYYDLCLQNSLSLETEAGYVYAFGGELIGSWSVKPAPGIPNSFDFTEMANARPSDVSRHINTIALTDNKSFLLMNNCWLGGNQRGWDLITTTPGVDTRTAALVSDYVASLGFAKDKFVFFKHGTCRRQRQNCGSCHGAIGQ